MGMFWGNRRQAIQTEWWFVILVSFSALFFLHTHTHTPLSFVALSLLIILTNPWARQENRRSWNSSQSMTRWNSDNWDLRALATFLQKSPSTCLVGEIASESLMSVLGLRSSLTELFSFYQEKFIQRTFIEHLQCARHRIWKRDVKLSKTWSLSSQGRQSYERNSF